MAAVRIHKVVKQEVQFETKADEQAAHTAYSVEIDDIMWVQQATRACLQEPKRMQYPKKPNHKGHYTSDDLEVHGNLSALRSMRIQMLADAMEGRSNGEGLVARAKRKIVRSTVVFQDQYDYIWKLAKKGEWDKLMDECTSITTEMKQHLSTKSRHKRAHQMRKNLKVRREISIRFMTQIRRCLNWL